MFLNKIKDEEQFANDSVEDNYHKHEIMIELYLQKFPDSIVLLEHET